MIKRDYQLIAEVIDSIDPRIAVVKAQLVDRFMNRLAQDNERFDKAKFVDACWKSELPSVRKLMEIE